MRRNRRPTRALPTVWLAIAIATSIPASAFEFTRLVAHWADYSDPGYLSFIEDAKPEVVQVGFYGAHFWSLADTQFGGGYPAHLPVRGHAECAEWFKRLNGELHKRGAKVVGHMNVKFLVGDPDSAEGPKGFFKFYREQWDEKVLGPKPVQDPIDLLEKDRSGNPISNKNYGIGGMREYWACLNNPHWREVLKAWVRFGVTQGVDGFIANYFYRHDCHCQHCVAAWREYLRERFTAEQLIDRFGIGTMRSFLADLSAGKPLEEALAKRTLPLGALETAFKEHAKKVASAYGPDLDWTPLTDAEYLAYRDDPAAWVAAHPKRYAASMMWASRLSEDKDWKQAKAVLEKIIAAAPDNREEFNPYWALSLACRGLGDETGERAALAKFVQIDSNASEAAARQLDHPRRLGRL